MESVLFRVGADVSSLDRDMQRGETTIQKRIANMLGIRSKAEMEYTRIWKQAESERDAASEKSHNAELRRIEREKSAMIDRARVRRQERAELVAEWNERQRLKAEGAAAWKANRQEGIANWRANLAQQRQQMGISKEEKNTYGVNVTNLRRNVAGTKTLNPYIGRGIGGMVGGQIISNASSGSKLTSGLGDLAMYGIGSEAGGAAGEYIAHKALKKLAKSGLKLFSKGAFRLLGPVGAGIGGWEAGQFINDKFINEPEKKSAEMATETRTDIRKRLEGQIAQAVQMKKITQQQADYFQSQLGTNTFTGIGKVQKGLMGAGFKPISAAEMRAQREKDEQADYEGGKVGLSEMASEARRLTGTRHRKNYTVTPRMRYALKIEDLEEQANMAYIKGDDKSAQGFMAQAKSMRESAPWLKSMDRNPLRKSEEYLDAISQKLTPVAQMAETVNKS